MTKTRFELGEKVTFTQTIEKVRVAGGVEWHQRGLPARTVYSIDRAASKVKGHEVWVGEKRPFSEGIVVGARTLNDWSVDTEYEGGEYGMGYSYQVVDCIPGTGKKAWLVAYDMRRKPVLVLDEHVNKIPEEEAL